MSSSSFIVCSEIECFKVLRHFLTEHAITSFTLIGEREGVEKRQTVVCLFCFVCSFHRELGRHAAFIGSE